MVVVAIIQIPTQLLVWKLILQCAAANYSKSNYFTMRRRVSSSTKL